MNKKWLLQLADAIEDKYGKEVREHIMGDIETIENNHASISAWFERFTNGIDELNDKEFLTSVLAALCPCGGDEEYQSKLARYIKKDYEKSDSLEMFAELLDKRKTNRVSNFIELHGNVLYLKKRPRNTNKKGLCGKGCHCWLAMHADKYVSDIFCHCCTVGHDGRPFKKAFGNDIKIEFVNSIIVGGEFCASAVHLPDKK